MGRFTDTDSEVERYINKIGRETMRPRQILREKAVEQWTDRLTHRHVGRSCRL